jgi:hypothetical protein
MNKVFLFLIGISLSFVTFKANAQGTKCATMTNLEKRMLKDPSLRQRMEESEIRTQKWISTNPDFKRTAQVITIPVVFHVLWNDSIQNVSDEQIQSQIDVLNEDFRFLNADTLDGMHPFRSRAADTRIEFCLATRDPNGNLTTGITRTQTSVVSWNIFVEDEAENIKSSANGGKDNWDPTQYLNMYVVKLDSVILGFATFPESLIDEPNLDGVVIRYEAFGTQGTAGIDRFEKNSGGRTSTHEVGHWLNLRHIWGDDSCGNDFVSDTETAEEANFGCPTFPHKASNSCGAGSDGEMYMNYMDYVDDKCMNMFTIGQSERMTATITGVRSGLLTSLGCQTPLSVENNSNIKEVSVYPNPNSGTFTIHMSEVSPKNINIKIENVLGKVVKEINNISSSTIQVNSNNELQPGTYFIRIDAGNNNVITKKIFIIN